MFELYLILITCESQMKKAFTAKMYLSLRFLDGFGTMVISVYVCVFQ